MLTPSIVEPQKARFTKSNAIVKDHFYYHGNGFKWDRPATVTDKYYPYYHKQRNEFKPKIEELQQQEKQDLAVVEQSRREHIIEMKQDTQARYHQRVKERTLIQAKSQQPVKSAVQLYTEDAEDETLDIIAKRIDAAKHTRSNEISWNHLQRASKKYIDQVIRPVSVHREGEMMEYFKKKIEEEQRVADDQHAKMAEHHTAIRKIFLNKHEENYDKEKRLGLTPASNSCTSLPSYHTKNNSKEPLPSIHIDNDISRRESAKFTVPPCEPSLMTVDGEFKLKYPSSLPNLDAIRTRSIKTPSIDQLSRPRPESKREYSLDHPELKGMLIKNMDDKVFHNGNTFYQAIAAKSQFFQDTLKENRDSRKKKSSLLSSRNDRPQTTSTLGSIGCQESTREPASQSASQVLLTKGPHSGARLIVTKKPPTLNEKEEIYNDIDLFEKRMPLARTGGYGRAEMQEILRNLRTKSEC